MKPLKEFLKKSINRGTRAFGYEIKKARPYNKAHHDFVEVDRFIMSSYFKKDAIRSLYDVAIYKTGMEETDNFLKQCRFYNLHQLAQSALKMVPNGEFAECGCRKGHSTYILASILRDFGFKQGLHVFDSFEGLTDFLPDDQHEVRAMSSSQINEMRSSFASPEEEFRNNLSEFPFVHLYRGWIPDRFHEIKDRKFSFIHVDVDLYQATRDSVEFFWPLLLDGGIMAFDDYGVTPFPGATKAIDEFLRENSHSLFHSSPTGGAFVLK